MFLVCLRVVVLVVIFIGQSHGVVSRRKSSGPSPLRKEVLPPLPDSAVLIAGPDADGNFKSTYELFEYVQKNPEFVGSGHIIGRRFVYEVTRGKYASDIRIRA